MSSTSRTALIVDDDFMVRGFIADCLTLKGFKSLKAPDGLFALELARDYDGPIDLLVSDVQMPGLAGPEFACILSAERPETKVLIVSGRNVCSLHRGATQGMEVSSQAFSPGCSPANRPIAACG